MISQKSKLLNKYEQQKSTCIDFKIYQPKIPLKNQQILLKDYQRIINKNIQVKNQNSQNHSNNDHYISFKLKHQQQFSNHFPLKIKLDNNNKPTQQHKLLSIQNKQSPKFYANYSLNYKDNQNYNEQQSLNPFKSNLYFKKTYQNKVKQEHYNSSCSRKILNNKQLCQNFQKQEKYFNIKGQPKLTNIKAKQLYIQKEDTIIFQQQPKQRYLQDFSSFNNDKANFIRKQNYELKDKRFQGIQQNNNNLFRENQKKCYKNFTDSNQKYEGNFFLTNPQWVSENKYNLKETDKLLFKEQQKNYQNNVHQFCFSLSTINDFPCPNNLFSNSNDNLIQIKSNISNCKNQNHATKKIYLKRLIEEFVLNLDEIDEKSLNQKAVNQLQEIIQSLIFKDKQNQQIVIQKKEYRNSQIGQFKNKQIAFTDAKKWNKSKAKYEQTDQKQFLTERKSNLIYKQEINTLKIQRKSPFLFKHSQRKLAKKMNNFINLSLSKETKKNQHSKQNLNYYHPNLPTKSQQIKKEQNQNLFSKFQKPNRSLVLSDKLNPKNGIYFKNFKSPILHKNSKILNQR